MRPIRRLGIVFPLMVVVLVLALAGCTSSAAPTGTRAAKAAQAAALRAESAANAAEVAAKRAEAAAEASATRAEAAAKSAAQAAAAISSTSTCTSSQLAVELGPDDAAMGHIGQVVSFKNVSTKSCALKGYPGLEMLDAAGHPIPTEMTDGPSYIVPSLPERTVVLTVGSEASFDLGFSDATGYGTAVCPTSARVAVTPPDAGQPIEVTWRIQPYGGSTIATLECGQISVSPVFAGSGMPVP